MTGTIHNAFEDTAEPVEKAQNPFDGREPIRPQASLSHSIVLVIRFSIDQKVAHRLATVHQTGPHRDPCACPDLAFTGIPDPGAEPRLRGNASDLPILPDHLGDATLPAASMAAMISWREQSPDDIVAWSAWIRANDVNGQMSRPFPWQSVSEREFWSEKQNNIE
jgi:hypothetical protein